MQFTLALNYHLEPKLVSKYKVGRDVQKHSSNGVLFIKVVGPIYFRSNRAFTLFKPQMWQAHYVTPVMPITIFVHPLLLMGAISKN